MKICLECEGIATQERDRCDSCGAVLLPVDAVHYPVRRGEADASNPLLGTVVDGKYRLKSVLGRGGMGTVFAAVHEVSLVPVAVKLLHPRLAARTEYRKSLLAEARKAGRVVHDHCARVLDVGETVDGTVYLAMELADGETLDGWVRGGGLPPSVVVDLLVQVCRALMAIHAASLVHRDLSSRNVMVAVADGRPLVKVLDFGIAGGMPLPGPGGTEIGGADAFANPVFSAPEVLAGQPGDARADLYGLGVLAFLALTGRLPVDAIDPRQAARATVAGQIERLPSLPGVPRRLHRVITRCLERDPARRPATAAAVLAELELVRGVRRPWVERVAIAAFVLASMLAVLAFAEPGEAFLQAPAGSRLAMAVPPLPADAAVQHLKPADLATVRCLFGGFRPDLLQLEVSRDGTALSRLPLLPVVDRTSAELTLTTAAAAWQKAVAQIGIASGGGPVDLSWSVPGRAPLAVARVRVDGEAPVVDWQFVPAPGTDAVGIRGDTRVRCTLQDTIGLMAAGFELQLPDGRRVLLPVPIDAAEFALGEALRGELTGVADQGVGTLLLWARDLAGNRTELTRSVTSLDPGVPGIAAITGPNGEAVVPYLGDRARILIRFTDAENGLTITVRDGNGGLLGSATGVAGVGPHELELISRSAATPRFRDGNHGIEIQDLAGNLRVVGWQASFRDRQVDPVLRVRAEDGGPPAVLLSRDELVAGTAGAALDFRCNPAFACVHVRLRGSDGAPLRDEASVLTWEASRPGEARITIGALAAGVHLLSLRIEGVGELAGREPSEPSWTLRVLPDVLEITVPTASSRYLPGLIDAGVLALQGALIRDGVGWRMDPGMLRFVHGELWMRGRSWSMLPLPERRGAEDPLLPTVAPAVGRNDLALLLRDVLGRPVRLRQGGGAARTIEHEGRQLQQFAEFWYHDAGPALLGEGLRVEFEQPLVVPIRLPLRFRAEERQVVRLGVGSAEYDAQAFTDDPGGGCVATFAVPAQAWVSAAGLESVPRGEYGNNHAGRIEAYVRTPARTDRQPLRLSVRTTRSILRPVRVGEILTAAPPALAALQFLPVLAPEGTLPDPLGEDPRGREAFASTVAGGVRSVGDLLLQDREVTRGAWAALLRLWQRLGGAASSALVHADDPAGVGRLATAAMLPEPWGDRVEAFLAAADAEPERPITGVTFFQAYAFCRLLGEALAGDPELFRLPFGHELDLAAFGGRPVTARHGARVAGGVDGRAFAAARSAIEAGDGPEAARELAVGDVVAAPVGEAPFLGLDFGVREWVFDLVGERDNDLWREWLSDHGMHLARATEFANGVAAPPAALAPRTSTLAVVRGLAFGEIGGLVDRDGLPLRSLPSGPLPDSVPGVVRAEQLRRDGRDLLPDRVDPRLRRVGFRLAAHRELQRRLRERP
ncbi:MAG: serine/threonine protein kinase [Planctomycetes bacterium]|nr:serine/threonine protein kinase [Planctomycetota bacterium]